VAGTDVAEGPTDMRVVYVADLDLDPVDVAAARAVTRRWLAGRFAAACGQGQSGTWEGSGSSVRWRRRQAPGVSAFQIAADWPDEDPGLGWRLETVVWDANGAAGAQVRLTAVPVTARLTGTVAFDAGDPGLVAALTRSVGCRDGGRRLSTDAVAGDTDVAQLCVDPRRRLPVVVLGASDDPLCLDMAAARLVGLAHAVAAGERTEDLVMVPPGAARVLWAGWRPRVDGRCTFVPAPRTGAGWVQAARTVVGAAAFRLPASPVIAVLDDHDSATRTAEMRQLRERVAHAQRPAELAGSPGGAPAAAAADLDELLTLVDDAERRLERAVALLDDERRRAAAAEATAAELVDELIVWEQNFAVVVEAAAARRANPAVVVGATDVEDLVGAFAAAAQLPRIVVTDDAARDAARFTFARPAEVLADLRELDRLCGQWADGTLSEGISRAAFKAGLPWRSDVSDSARRLGRHVYVTSLDGESVDLGPHLAYGSAGGAGDAVLRIYMAFDRSGHRVIVGRAMRHGPDKTN
jgi:hypothetical protein